MKEYALLYQNKHDADPSLCYVSFDTLEEARRKALELTSYNGMKHYIFKAIEYTEICGVVAHDYKPKEK